MVPAELRQSIGLEPGDLVMVTHAGGRRVMIEPVGDDPVAAARGMLKDGRSLVDALQEERKDDDARGTQKAARLMGDPGPAQR